MRLRKSDGHDRVAMAVRKITELRDRMAATERHSSKVFKALSDDTRRQILFLLEERQRNVSEIAQQFDLTQPTISRHLSVLRDADLIRDDRQGPRVVYSLNDTVLNSSMQQFFGRFRGCQRSLR